MKLRSIKEELRYISKLNGGICSPYAVVKYAKNPKTLLHSKFTWDDDKAAFEYRLWQARRIISLELMVIENEKLKEPISIRMYHSLPEDRCKNGGYRLVTDIMQDESLRNQLVEYALRELVVFQNKYKSLKELDVVFKAIDKVSNRLSKKLEIDISQGR